MNKRTLVEFVVRFTQEAAPSMLGKMRTSADAAPGQQEHLSAVRVSNDCLALLRLASQHKRLCELQCSSAAADRDRVPCPGEKREGWCCCDYQDGKHSDVARIAAQRETIEHKLPALLKPYGIGVHFSGDPRGCTVKLKLPSGYTDDWGHEGFCVPQQGLTAAQLNRMG